jgi:hypothetical protein
MSAPGPTETETPRWLLIVVGALAAVAVVVAWGARLSWGLWQDETHIAWQAEGGWTIVRDKLGDPAQSVLFGYLEALFYFPGSPHMELWLRLPAVLGGIASGLLAYRLAERLVGKGTGLTAFVAMIGSPQMIVLATQARPYTWAVAACLASLLGLARWLETGRRRDGLLFAIASALVVHLHLLFATFAVVPAFFVLRRARRGQPVDWRGLLGWLGLTALLLMPLLVLLRRVSQGPDPSAIGLASLGDALADLIPSTVLFSLIPLAFVLVVASLGAAIAGRGAGVAAVRAAGVALRGALAREPAELAVFWLLAPPLLLLALSHLRHQTIYLDRYFLHTIAAQALIVAMLFRRVPRAVGALALAACLFTPPILYGARTWSQTETIISWRPPFRAIRQLDPAGTAPVFLQSSHPPSNAMDWQRGIEQRAFLYSPVVAYPVPNHVYPLPYDPDASMESFVRRLADTDLANAPLIFVTGLPKHVTIEWVRRFFEARGYQTTHVLRDGYWLLALRLTPAGGDGPS